MYFVIRSDTSLQWCSPLKTDMCEETLFIADDGCEVIPTIILLAASPVLRSMVSETIFFSPMALTITGVSRHVLMCVRQLLCTGEANVKSNMGDEVTMAMTMLGIESSLNLYQIENCGQGNMNGDQEKADDEVEVKSNLKEAKLDIYVKLGEYVERESGNNVGHEFEDDVKPEFESTNGGGEMKHERSSDCKKDFDLMETDKNNNSVSEDEDHENDNGHGEKYTNVRKRKRVLRFGMKEDKVKVDSRSSTKSLDHNRRQKKGRDPRTIIPDTYPANVYAYDDSSLKCDGCEACPIRSEIYKCTVCKDYDLCSSCKEDGTHAETEHKMRKVPMHKCTGCEFKSPKKGLCKICKKWKFKI